MVSQFSDVRKKFIKDFNDKLSNKDDDLKLYFYNNILSYICKFLNGNEYFHQLKKLDKNDPDSFSNKLLIIKILELLMYNYKK